MLNDYILNEYSIEPIESRTYYLLNQELLNYKKQLDEKSSNAISLRNIGIFFSYIKNGAFSRIIRRLKKATHPDTALGYSLKNYSSFPKSKVVVYSCIWGPYDKIAEPLYYNPAIDYILVTDQEVPASSKWSKMNFPNVGLLDSMGPSAVNRYCKMMPHVLFPDYDYSIYIDGNIQIVTDLMPLIADLGEHTIGIHSYPVDCIYNMKNAIIAGKKATKESLDCQIKNYKREGFPKHYGAFECNVLVRKHNDNDIIKLMESWWEEYISTSSKRDQISLPYVLWKSNKTADFIYSLGPDVRLNPRFQLTVEHRK